MVFPPPGIAIDELAGHRMRRRFATDRTRRPARSHRRQTNGSGALRRTPPPSPSPLDPPTSRHPPPLRNSQGGGGTLGGGVAARSGPPSPYGLRAPTPFASSFCSGGTRQHHTSGVPHYGKHGWRKQQRRAHQTCPGFTPEPPGSHRSFALQQTPQSERPLLRGSTPSIYKFNNNSSNSNDNTNIIRQHPATLAPGGFRRARNALKAPWHPAWVGYLMAPQACAAREGASRVACAACPAFRRAQAIALSRHSSTHSVVRFANPPAHPREETEDDNDSLPPLRFPSAPRGSPHPPPKDKTMNPVWYRARASASLRHQPVCLLGHAPCVNRQGSCPRSISRPHHARQRLPHSIGHSFCRDRQTSRPPSFGRLRRAPVRPLWAPREKKRNAKRGAKRVAQAARKVNGILDRDNFPPATFHAVQEEQSSCQERNPVMPTACPSWRTSCKAE